MIMLYCYIIAVATLLPAQTILRTAMMTRLKDSVILLLIPAFIML